jgi:hypothetical protein
MPEWPDTEKPDLDAIAPAYAPFLIIEINGVRGSFRAYRKVNQWALMASAAADKTGNQAEILAANYNVARTSVMPEDRARFDQFMMINSDDTDDVASILFDALGNLWAGETMLPLLPESTDGSDSTGRTDSTSTLNSSDVESGPEWTQETNAFQVPNLELTGSSSPESR